MCNLNTTISTAHSRVIAIMQEHTREFKQHEQQALGPREIFKKGKINSAEDHTTLKGSK